MAVITHDRPTGSFGNRLAVWRAGLARPSLTFRSQPEPRSIGLFARGRQLVAGNFLFAGKLVQAPGVAVWDVPAPDADFAAEAQGFVWLDDLAAFGDAVARKRAQDWTYGWIARFGRGQGPGWTPELTGRRLIRWVNHSVLLLQGRDKAQADAYFRALTVQTHYLARRWTRATPGLPRFEALTGLIVAALALEGKAGLVDGAIAALSRDCQREVDAGGGIPTRNPEDLLEVFTLLNWAAQALTEAGRAVPEEVTDAIVRIAPTLRALRHADGGLARFHGGGRGIEGRLDAALAASGVRGGAGRFAGDGLCAPCLWPDDGDRGCCVPAGRAGRGRGACLDPGVRADLGPPPVDRQQRIGSALWRGLANGRAGHGVAFDAVN